jgi:hypothetical protein
MLCRGFLCRFDGSGERRGGRVAERCNLISQFRRSSEDKQCRITESCFFGDARCERYLLKCFRA